MHCCAGLFAGAPAPTGTALAWGWRHSCGSGHAREEALKAYDFSSTQTKGFSRISLGIILRAVWKLLCCWGNAPGITSLGLGVRTQRYSAFVMATVRGQTYVWLRSYIRGFSPRVRLPP
jgi:hypothetical protein